MILGVYREETNKLTLHLAVETLVLCLNKIHTNLLSVDSVSLADLVLQSHTVMVALEHAADAVVHFHVTFTERRGLCRYQSHITTVGNSH